MKIVVKTDSFLFFKKNPLKDVKINKNERIYMIFERKLEKAPRLVPSTEEILGKTGFSGFSDQMPYYYFYSPQHKINVPCHDVQEGSRTYLLHILESLIDACEREDAKEIFDLVLRMKAMRESAKHYEFFLTLCGVNESAINKIDAMQNLNPFLIASEPEKRLIWETAIALVINVEIDKNIERIIKDVEEYGLEINDAYCFSKENKFKFNVARMRAEIAHKIISSGKIREKYAKTCKIEIKDGEIISYKLEVSEEYAPLTIIERKF